MQNEGVTLGNDNLGYDKSTMINLPADENLEINEEQLNQESEADGMSPIQDNFDDTTAPLVHPNDQGPVSLGTQHAVHLLRDRFSGSESIQNKTNVLFHDLLPELTTSKADATKMFFEILVLATKDAVKVEQAGGKLGGAIRIRGKRGLWGAWAEREAGGEIAQQDEPSATATAVS